MGTVSEVRGLVYNLTMPPLEAFCAAASSTFFIAVLIWFAVVVSSEDGTKGD